MANYLFASGNLIALETKLLTPDQILKARSSDSLNDYAKALENLGYGMGEHEIKAMMKQELAEARREVLSLAPNKAEAQSFFLSLEARNIKTLYKIKFYLHDESLMNLCEDDGLDNLDALKEAILYNDTSKLDKSLRDLIETINMSVKSEDAARVTDTLIDECLYAWALKSTKSPSVIDYLKLKIDATNITSLKRAKALGFKAEDIQAVLIKGGSLECSQLIAMSDEELIKATSMIASGKISSLLANTPDAGSFEKGINQICLDEAKTLSYDGETAGPMLYYYLVKAAEAQNVGLVASESHLNKDDLLAY